MSPHTCYLCLKSIQQARGYVTLVGGVGGVTARVIVFTFFMY